MKQTRKASSLGLVFLLCVAGFGQQAQSANAVVPPMIKFSGVLTDGTNKPLSGTVGVSFALYKESQGGALLWIETQNVQADRNGHYSVMLGSTASHGLPAELFTSGEARWLGVQPEQQAEQPRVLLLSVPYAMKAVDAETVGGLPPSAFMRATPQQGSGAAASSVTGTPQAISPPTVHGNGTLNLVPLWTGKSLLGSSILIQSGSKLGVGIDTPATTLDVNGAATIRGNETVTGTLNTSGTLTGQAGSFTANNGASVLNVFQQGNGAAVFAGFNTGIGIDSFSLATSGNTVGVQGIVVSPTGTGVVGQGATGVHGVSLSTTGTGVLGQSPSSALSSTGQLIRGQGPAGLWGDTAAHPFSGVGVVATADVNSALLAVNNGSAPTLSVANRASNSSSGILLLNSAQGQMSFDTGGNLRIATGANLGAVIAEIGDAGCGPNYYGLELGQGVFMSNCTNYSLLGDINGNTYINSSTATGTIFVRNNNNTLVTIDPHGNMNVNGNLSKGGGSFKIDHPLDPANKYLYHSFVESPDMMNLYNGNVVTDGKGFATVGLPDYFSALNRDFRYQLTVIGQFAQAIVAREIEGGRFTIQTSAPLVKVSWQVTGVRQDAWANAHRIPVEVEKPSEERGHYLHPELFGAAQQNGIK